jgi:hypothetical protein
MGYQLWDTLQVMFADLRGIIISQASLIGMGVGVASASALDTIRVDMAVGLLGTAVALAAGAACDSGGSVATMKRWRVYNTLLSYFSTAMSLLQVPSRWWTPYASCDAPSGARLGPGPTQCSDAPPAVGPPAAAQGMDPARRLHFACANTLVQNAVSPLGGGAGQAVVMHLSLDSMDASFRADVAAKESNQDRLLGLLVPPLPPPPAAPPRPRAAARATAAMAGRQLLPARYGLLLWVGADFRKAWLVVAALRCE